MSDALTNIEFIYPSILWFLLLIPGIIVMYFLLSKNQKSAISITTIGFLGSLSSRGKLIFHIPFLLRCLAIASLIVALARPMHFKESETITGEGIDIMLCLDVSGTMKYQDFLPTRLEAAKDMAIKFVHSRFGDRIGVVVFSDNGFTICPLTTDTSAVNLQINNITDSVLSGDGTVIGTGIAYCINRLKNSKSKSRVIILLSDGVNSPDAISPIEAASMASEMNIKIYTIGIGSNREVKTIKHTPYGDIPGFEKSEFNDTLLQQISGKTGGEYFHALDNAGLDSGFQSIHNLEKTSIKKSARKVYSDKTPKLLLFVFFVLFTETVLRYTYFRKFP